MWGAFVDEKLVSGAATLLLGNTLGDIGVITEEVFRGQGLAVTCAGLLCKDILQRGRIPTRTTSRSTNKASVRAAEKLGFEWRSDETLYFLRGAPQSG